MTPIHFQANYLPNHRQFRVTVKVGSQKRFSEKMTISKFMRMARNPDKPLVVAGTTITFNGSAEAEKAVRDYFKKVADSYLAYKTQQN